MNKKIFIANNIIILVLVIISLFIENFQLAILGLILASRMVHGVIFVIDSLKSKSTLLLGAILIALYIAGALIQVTEFVAKIMITVIIGMETFIHLMNGRVQFIYKEKTWFINVIIGVFFGLLLIPVWFKFEITYILGALYGIMGLSAAYYLIYYFKTKEIPGNYSLLNINQAIFKSAYTPQELFKSLENLDEEAQIKYLKSQEIGDDQVFNQKHITVYLHAWQPTSDMMGHADLGFENYNYSLSNYDVENEIMDGMVSTGIISITPLKQYLNYCIDIEKKVVIGYTIALSDEEYAKVKNVVASFLENSQEWIPKDIKQNKAADMIMNHTDAKLRQVLKGPFKYYFALGTNCVKMVDSVLSQVGIETNVSKNLLVPGEYIKRLDQLANDPTSNVKAKRYYWKQLNHEEVH